MSDVEDFLAHYGVKGMRWGKRKNPNYSDQQVKRDVQVYGKRGAKRINNSLNDGNSISVARGDEKTRRDNVMAKNKYVRQGGKIAGAAAGVVVGKLALSGVKKAVMTETGQKFLAKMMGAASGGYINPVQAQRVGRMALTIEEFAKNPVVNAAVMAGAGKVGHMLAGDVAVNVRMRAHGYDPNRK